jgi:hypothetical protein
VVIPSDSQSISALVAIRRKRHGGDATWLFRSYNHNPRLEDAERELNPRTLGSGSAKIWEACRASSAAPLYFNPMKIDDSLYMDGGLGRNNPARLAWNEAKWMSNRKSPHSREVRALLSIGTGVSRSESRFGPINMLQWARKTITETKGVHHDMLDITTDTSAHYWRFDVKPAENGSHDGLIGIKISDCKKKKVDEKTKISEGREKSSASSTSSTNDWHRDLQEEAMEQRDGQKARKKGKYKPDKYAYETFDLIFERTESYCTSSQYDDNRTVEDAINECGDLLLKFARQRQLHDPVRFRRFISHPHPYHEKHLVPFKQELNSMISEDDGEDQTSSSGESERDCDDFEEDASHCATITLDTL